MKKILTIKNWWMISYIAVAVLAIVICNLSFSAHRNIFTQSLVASYDNSTDYICRNIDSRLNTLNLCVQSITSAGIMETLPTISNQQLPLRYVYKPYVEHTNAVIATAGIVDQYYIYFPLEDIMISPSGNALSSAQIYNVYHACGSLSYEEWLFSISSKDVSFFADLAMQSSGVQLPYIFCCKSGKTAAGETYFIVLMSRLSSTLGNSDYLRKNNLIIFSNSKVVYQNKDFNLSGFEPNSRDTIYTNADTNEKYIVLSNNSECIGWTYTFFVPYGSYWEQSIRIRNITFATNIICIIICFVLAYCLAKRNYAPLHSILTIFDKNQNAQLRRNRNSFTYIRKNIETLIAETDALNDTHEKLTRNTLLIRLLLGHVPKSTHSDALLANNGITSEKKYLALVRVRIINYRKLFPNDNEIGGHLPIETVTFLVVNVAQDTLLQFYDSFYCHLDNDVYFIVKRDDKDSQSLQTLVQDLCDKLKEYALIEVRAVMSQNHSSFYDLHVASKECDHASRYQEMFNETAVVAYETIKNRNQHYSYSAQDEEKIVNAITTGNKQKANEYINSIFEKNLNSNITAEAVNMLYYSMFTTLFHISDSINLSGMQEQLSTYLTKVTDIDQARENINTTISTLCTHFSTQSSQLTVSNQVIDIIKSSYQDVNLSVAEIGYKMNRAPRYISRTFKRETGETLSAYIQKYRISVAKELLLNTNLSIREIANNVGYTNSNVFISSFKNLEGVTPGKYKTIAK